MSIINHLSAAFLIYLSALSTEATRLYIEMPFDLVWMP